MGLLDNDLPGLLSNVKNALLEAYDSATKPNGGMSNALAEYLMNTPNRFRDNVNTNFPDPRLLRQQNPEGQNARESVANALLNFAAPTVYHGTPHRFAPTAKNPLGAFDASKIGTGEGAQAYGHGLYVAENPSVAGAYKSAGKPSYEITYKGQDVPQDHILARAISAHDGDLTATEKWLSNQSSQDGQINNALALLKNKGSLSVNKPDANLYKADLPDSAAQKMLDWDKPLSQQHPDVRKVAQDLLEFHQPSGSVVGADRSASYKRWDQDLTGAQIRELLELKLGKGGVEAELKAAGIPGIRYLDGGSRGSGAGTNNYVVFPGFEHLLKIIGRE